MVLYSNEIKDLVTALLKENGSLDIERINKLPYEEYMDEIGTLTEEQIREYISKLPQNKSKEPVQAVKVDYGFDDEKCGIDTDVLLNNMKKKYGTNK